MKAWSTRSEAMSFSHLEGLYLLVQGAESGLELLLELLQLFS